MPKRTSLFKVVSLSWFLDARLNLFAVRLPLFSNLFPYCSTDKDRAFHLSLGQFCLVFRSAQKARSAAVIGLCTCFTDKERARCLFLRQARVHRIDCQASRLAVGNVKSKVCIFAAVLQVMEMCVLGRQTSLTISAYAQGNLFLRLRHSSI